MTDCVCTPYTASAVNTRPFQAIVTSAIESYGLSDYQSESLFRACSAAIEIGVVVFGLLDVGYVHAQALMQCKMTV